MTGALRLSFEHECGYNLFTAPVNWVRNWLRQKALCYAVRAASNRRSTMSPGVALDLDAHISLTSRLDNDKQRDMLMIQAGGLWTASSMHKAGFLATPTCPWCRCAPETLQHLWWECESFQEQRTAALAALRASPGRSCPAASPCMAYPLRLLRISWDRRSTGHVALKARPCSRVLRLISKGVTV